MLRAVGSRGSVLLTRGVSVLQSSPVLKKGSDKSIHSGEQMTQVKKALGQSAGRKQKEGEVFAEGTCWTSL